MSAATTVLIQDVRVLDGTGTHARAADVEIRDGRVAAIGHLPPPAHCRVIKGRGRYLSPGFIDVHTHDDTSVVHGPEMRPKLSQGVTTVVVGNCGISASPISLRTDEVPDPMNLLGPRGVFTYPEFTDYASAVDRARPSVNVAALVGHTTLRAGAMADLERPASGREIEAMRTRLAASLHAGAFGLSSGLAYRNARQAPPSEMDALVRELGLHGAVYTTHLRNEFDRLPQALDEAFATAAKVGVRLQVSHLKCAGAGNWGHAPQALAMVEHAAKDLGCHCDCYPYTASSSTLDLGQVNAETDILITWSEPHPEMARRRLNAIAAEWQLPLAAAAKKLQPAGAVYHNMSEADVRRILAHPLVMIGSDGLPNDPFPHPRLWGAFPRVIGHYCRDERLFPLPEAIRKMTGLPAAAFGLADRGVVRPGAWADLVLFDFDRVRDTATFAAPKQAAEGIDLVMVNGRIAWQDGGCVDRPGRFLRRGAA
ncbi:MAG TPA: D-aminoacylase [Rhodanobacteraceae bacterium]|nr:D-aminoacylase [Rhodanobacteraceae bacterium]